MSILLMAHVMDCELTSAQKFVLLVMANFANDEGENVFPSHDTIAKKTSLTRRGVVKLVQELTELGYVKLEGKRGNRQNIYSLNVEKITQMCTPFTGRCEPSSHNPLIEPLDSNKEIKQLKDLATSEPSSQQNANLYPMMEALATTCGRLLADNRAMLGRYAKKLVSLKYTPADVTAFATWWYAHDWRGKQKQAPAPAQVVEFIGLSKSKKLNDGWLDANTAKWRAEAKRIKELNGDDDDLQTN